MNWLLTQTQKTTVSAIDVQATLLELSAVAIAKDCKAANSQEVYLCGGGAKNRFLRERLATHLGETIRLGLTDDLGVPGQDVEAMAFAWLAHRLLAQLPGNLAQVTGAAGPRILGSLTA